MRLLKHILFSFVIVSTFAGCIHTHPFDGSTDAPPAQDSPSERAAAAATAPASPVLDWHLHDAEGPYRGVSVHKAYRSLLADKTPRKRVVVAIMDSGVDLEHEDLRPNIWINRDEVPNNGKDDDENGYVDDVHGWNFVADAEGNTVALDTYEVTRERARLRRAYADVDPATLAGNARDEYAYYLEVEDAYEARRAHMETAFARSKAMLDSYDTADSLLAAYTGTEDLTAADVAAIENEDEALLRAKQLWLGAAESGMDAKSLKRSVDMLGTRLNAAFDLDRDLRAHVYSADSQFYGNHDLYGPDPFHGTHVAGIIGAVRANGIGIDGVADHVEIMAIRTTPQGDERDRDVANGIRYAVDNGADIINMSFGKSHSGDKSLVDNAVRYAAAHDVLLVHGSGNDGNNLDVTSNFPEPFYLDGTEAPNWIEVGATSWKTGESFAAFFSNYGKRTVDVFAPGRDIYSAQPGNDYAALNGTSLSAPIVSGIAALVMSYYPELSAEQVREVVLRSATSYAGRQVNQPTMTGQKTVVDFATLSSTGGVVDAYEALRLAEEMAGGRHGSR